MILIDTGYLVALVREQDELHERAHRWAEHASERAVLTDYIVVETLNSLSHPLHRPRIHRIIELIRSSSNYELVIVDEPLFAQGLALHRGRADKAWSLTDCVSFVLMQQRGIARALAYDHHFEQAGFEPLLRRDP
jgi:predicted nucleic acid-binding protein